MKSNHIFLIVVSILIACTDNDVPSAENEEEVINKVVFSFVSSNHSGLFEWYDEDGEGSISPVSDRIVLKAGEEYFLTLTLVNNMLNTEIINGVRQEIDLSKEIIEEADEHQLFFEFNNDFFVDPKASGNIGNSGEILYEDQDENGLPLGILTKWKTGDIKEGEFRVILKHQPDIKSTSSTSSDGVTDLDITLKIKIE